MRSARSGGRRDGAQAPSPRLERLEDRLAPATLTWLGDVDANWSTISLGNTNWSGDALPASGDTLVFAGAATGTLNNDTTAGNTYALQFTAAGYTINGNSITLNPVATSTTFAIQQTAATGDNSVNTPLTLGGPTNTVDVTTPFGSGQFTLGGVISGGGAAALVKSGDGRLRLTNSSNSYDGQTTINGGEIRALADHVLGSTVGGTTVSSTGTLLLNGVSYTTPEPLEINGDGGSALGAIQNNQTSSFAGPVTLGSNSLIRLTAANSFLTLTGTVNSIGSPRNLDVSAGLTSSRLTLAAAVGGTLPLATTTVTGTTLQVNSTMTSNVSVAGSGTLEGNGTITGNVTGSGIFSPGTSPGIMTINGNFTPSGVVVFEINSPFATAGVDYDQYIVSGTVDLSGANVTRTNNIAGPAPALPNLVTLISNTSGGATVINASTVPQDGASFPVGATPFRIFFNGGDGNNVVLANGAPPTTVYVDDDFTGNDGTVITDADPVAGGNQSAVMGVNAFDTIQEGVDAVADGGTVKVNPHGPFAAPTGVYAESVSIAKALTLDGNGGPGGVTAVDVVIDASTGNGITISSGGNNVTVRDLRVTGAVFGVLAIGVSGLSLTNVRTDTNTGDGIILSSLTGATTLTNVVSQNNGDDGLEGNSLGAISISSSNFSNNGTTSIGGDGIQLTNVGAVTTTSVTADANDPGIFINQSKSG